MRNNTAKNKRFATRASKSRWRRESRRAHTDVVCDMTVRDFHVTSQLSATVVRRGRSQESTEIARSTKADDGVVLGYFMGCSLF